MVVVVSQPTEWLEPPDLLLPLAWAVETGAGLNPPIVLWVSDTPDAERRWQIDDDIARMGITRLRQTDDALDWVDLLDLADLVVLSRDSTLDLPDGFADLAAHRRLPILCWEGHPRAAELAARGNAVVPWGDISAMAARVVDATTTPEGWARAVEPSWRPLVADVERVTPLRVPAR
jgi:hypothetical protein